MCILKIYCINLLYSPEIVWALTSQYTTAAIYQFVKLFNQLVAPSEVLVKHKQQVNALLGH